MNDLLKAIYSEFAAGTELHTAIPAKLFYDRAKAGTAEPYGIYLATTGIPDDTFSQDIDEMGIQFSFFTADMETANDLIKKCKQLYNGKKLSTGAVMRRVLTVAARRSGDEDEAGWQADIEFIVLNEV